ncbi:MAG: hypothetical protein LBL34_02055 [Clostridiales bacterium]|jgi:hypothetical protein|nr:hypothetical protein [Clostridiales bacterium]
MNSSELLDAIKDAKNVEASTKILMENWEEASRKSSEAGRVEEYEKIFGEYSIKISEADAAGTLTAQELTDALQSSYDRALSLKAYSRKKAPNFYKNGDKVLYSIVTVSKKVADSFMRKYTDFLESPLCGLWNKYADTRENADYKEFAVESEKLNFPSGWTPTTDVVADKTLLLLFPDGFDAAPLQGAEEFFGEEYMNVLISYFGGLRPTPTSPIPLEGPIPQNDYASVMRLKIAPSFNKSFMEAMRFRHQIDNWSSMLDAEEFLAVSIDSLVPKYLDKSAEYDENSPEAGAQKSDEQNENTRVNQKLLTVDKLVHLSPKIPFLSSSNPARKLYKFVGRERTHEFAALDSFADKNKVARSIDPLRPQQP